MPQRHRSQRFGLQLQDLTGQYSSIVAPYSRWQSGAQCSGLQRRAKGSRIVRFEGRVQECCAMQQSPDQGMPENGGRFCRFLLYNLAPIAFPAHRSELSSESWVGELRMSSMMNCALPGILRCGSGINECCSCQWAGGSTVIGCGSCHRAQLSQYVVE